MRNNISIFKWVRKNFNPKNWVIKMKSHLNQREPCFESIIVGGYSKFNAHGEKRNNLI